MHIIEVSTRMTQNGGAMHTARAWFKGDIHEVRNGEAHSSRFHVAAALASNLGWTEPVETESPSERYWTFLAGDQS